MQKAIGIDLGSSPVTGILADIKGNILEHRQVEIPMDTSFEEAIKKIISLAGKLKQFGVSGAGIGTPGWLDPGRGIFHRAPNYPRWKEVNLTEPIRNVLGLTTYIINDVNACALGEKYFGAAKQAESNYNIPRFMEIPMTTDSIFDSAQEGQDIGNMIFITVGVGIGGGIIINNELVTGAHQGAGEVGHITLEPEGPPCGCGSFGCFEALCSMTAIKKAVANGLNRKIETKLTRYISIPEELTFEILRECVLLKDEFAWEIISVMGHYMGIGLGVVTNLFDPNIIVIGGEVVTILDLLRPLIADEMKMRVKIIPHQEVRIVPAKLGRLAGAFGAAAMVFKRLYNL